MVNEPSHLIWQDKHFQTSFQVDKIASTCPPSKLELTHEAWRYWRHENWLDHGLQEVRFIQIGDQIMAEQNKEQWLNYLALTTIVFAVCATLSTFKGGSFSTRSVMSQSQASDQWAYYQAKGIKYYLYQMQKEKLELELLNLQKMTSEEVISAYKAKIASYKEKDEIYEKEKSEIQDKAKSLEKTRDEAQLHSKAFGMAVIFLQIAILLSSIAALLKKKELWYLGMAAGIVGMVYFADGFLVFLWK